MSARLNSAVTVLTLLGVLTTSAQPPMVSLEVVARQFNEPLFATHAGDGSGRIFVVERAGKIRVILPDGDVQSEPFLDLGSEGLDLITTEGYTQGLLGLAFHPNCAENGRLFVLLSDRETGGATVLEFGVSPPSSGVAHPSPATILGPVPQIEFEHNGGTVAFGPHDGMLYISFGDGGGNGDPHGNGQDLSTLMGSILRVDVDNPAPPLAYGIPPDNPHVGTEGARAEIFAHGFRNPYRFSFDRGGDHRLFVGDVGQARVEEIDLVTAADNCGWPIMEGSECFNAADFSSPLPSCDSQSLSLPIHEYGREPGVPFTSVTGGVVYRGTRSAQLWGMYVFGDFQTGEVWTLEERGDGEWIRHDLLETGFFISSFGEDEQGEILLTDYFDGRVLRIVAPAHPVMGSGAALR